MSTQSESRLLWTMCWLALAGMIIPLEGAAQIPQRLNHQGMVRVDGQAYQGPGLFRFALVDASTAKNTWTNDGTQVGTAGTPANAVTLDAVDGVYSVALGDTTVANMTVLSGAALSDDDMRLRIWFDDGTHGIQQLVPDQVVSSAAFAFKAESAETAGLLGGSTESSLEESAEIDADVNTHNSNPNAHASIQLSAARITSGKVDNARLNAGHGNGLDADTVDGAEAATLEESAEIDADINTHNSNPNVHANIQLDAARLTSGKIDNVRLNTGHGNGLDADTLDGQQASAFMSAATDDWVDETGDHVDGSASFSAGAPEAAALLSSHNRGSGHGFYAETEGGSGAVGVYGAASSEGGVSNYGGYFEAAGENGRGVQAKASNEHGLSNYGGFFEAAASAGRGVYGKATGTNSRGVEGLSEGSNGIAVFGKASNTGAGNVIGGYFEASGSVGRGVQGYASNTANAVNYGGYFEAKGGQGRGIYSKASGSAARGPRESGGASGSKTSTNYGGYFEADGETGQAVYGEATDATGANIGGNFAAAGETGYAVRGEATNTQNDTNYGGYFVAAGQTGRGIYGESSSTSGENYGGFFKAMGIIGQGVHGEAVDGTGLNYGGHFTSASSQGRGVHGEASNISGGVNYGGYFAAAGISGQGVHAIAYNAGAALNYGGYFQAEGISGQGLHAKATGETGTGLYAEATDDGDGEKYGGYFTAAGANGTGIYADGGGFDFYSAGGGGAEYGPFTGSHEVKLADGFPQDFAPGMIVCVTGEAQRRLEDGDRVGLSSTLPTVRLADRAKDKAVFGAIIAETALRENHWYAAGASERFGIVNALGEGRVSVCDHNGPIEAGDYITTSPIPGYGQRQDDDLVHAYTLGKATETIDWDAVADTFVVNNEVVKTALIAVVYCSG